MKTMKHRAMLAQAICDEGLRRIAEAATEAGLPELATEAEALLPWLPTIAAEAMETTESAAPPPAATAGALARLLETARSGRSGRRWLPGSRRTRPACGRSSEPRGLVRWSSYRPREVTS
jgi:hypothetical protein